MSGPISISRWPLCHSHSYPFRVRHVRSQYSRFAHCIASCIALHCMALLRLRSELRCGASCPNLFAFKLPTSCNLVVASISRSSASFGGVVFISRALCALCSVFMFCCVLFACNSFGAAEQRCMTASFCFKCVLPASGSSSHLLILCRFMCRFGSGVLNQSVCPVCPV